MAVTDRVASEDELIAHYLAPLASGFPGAFGLADDCAALAPRAGEDLVLKTDAVAEGVHFLADDPPADIAWKALAVNVSDLAAKSAEPRVYLMSLSFPSAPERAWLAAFADGLGKAQAAFGIHLAGGDTDRRKGPLSVTIMVIGAVPKGRMVRRGTARPGDRIYVSGTLGDSALGLRLCQREAAAESWPLFKSERAKLIARYRRPQPRLALQTALRAHARAAMDLSDGLVKDLGRMCRASGVGAIVRAGDVPLSKAARKVAAATPRWRAAYLTGGDDYEILSTVPPAGAAAYEAEAAAAGVPVTAIGEIAAGDGVRVLDAEGRPMTFKRTGYDHF